MSARYIVLVQPSAFGVGSRIRCEQCGEERELVLMENHLEAIAAISTAYDTKNAATRVAAVREHREGIDGAASECIEVVCWFLTHTTGHDEQRRRDMSRAAANENGGAS
jgi:hypothetical protein